MTARFMCSLALCLVLLAGEASAATVRAIVGVALIDRGTGFNAMSTTEPESVGPHTRIMTKSHSEAVLRYDDDCEIRIEPGEVVTVREEPPCTSGGLHHGAQGLPANVIVGKIGIAIGLGAIVAGSKKSTASSP